MEATRFQVDVCRDQHASGPQYWFEVAIGEPGRWIRIHEHTGDQFATEAEAQAAGQAWASSEAGCKQIAEAIRWDGRRSTLIQALGGKRPTRYCNDGKTTYWTWFRMYEPHPVGLRPHLLAAAVFDRMREDEGIYSTDADGNPAFGVGFDTEEEAFEAALRATEALAAGTGSKKP